ncbi:SOS response-associated peptidase family protein [Lysobacter terrae]
MCYSAQVEQEYNTYVRKYGAQISIHEFVKLYVERRNGAKIRTAKAMDDAFRDPQTPEEREIHSLVVAYNAQEIAKAEQELFKQVKRLSDAERALQAKVTKKAQEDQRIATNKIGLMKERIANLKRSEWDPEDSRIFPGWYAPVMVMEQGRRVVKPMRYQCRPEGKPSLNDVKFPGTYNARRDSLGSYWKELFGYQHGLVVAHRFYENVEVDGKTQVLEFVPRTGEPMLIACLWSHWTDPTGKEPDLLSFAAITDDPEPEVAAAGHDRTIINIKPEHIDAWLNPDPKNLQALYAIFDDKRHPFYEHRLAA